MAGPAEMTVRQDKLTAAKKNNKRKKCFFMVFFRGCARSICASGLPTGRFLPQGRPDFTLLLNTFKVNGRLLLFSDFFRLGVCGKVAYGVIHKCPEILC